MRKFVCSLCVIAIQFHATAQTRIDLNTQTRNVDFSTAVSTRPFKVGPSLPATCRQGDMFFRVGNPTQVLYACTATNLWMLQSASAMGIGLLAQTSEGTTARSLTASGGIVITNADGVNGDPEIRGDIASQTDAEAGVLATKLMTPQRTLQAFMKWNPIPSQTGKAKSLLVTDGSTPSWTWKLIIPASTVQTITTASTPISADRLFVKVQPAATMTLSATPVIANGEDGQFVTIANVSSTASLTFPDEAMAPGSNMRLGGTNLTLAPNQSATFVFATGPGDWILTQKSGSNTTQFAGLTDVSINAPVDGQCTIYSAAAGKWQNAPCPSGGGSGDMTSAQAQANSRLYCADEGSTDTYACSVTPALQSHTTGMVVWFRPNTNNTGTATININGLGAKTITTESGSVLIDNTLRAGYTYPLWYDGNTFRVIWSSVVRPDPTHNEQKFITTDGVSEVYDSRFAPPPDEQPITSDTPLILPVSTNVWVTPDTSRTLCANSGLISDGAYPGQWLTIYNTSTTNTLTWQDKANCPGSKLAFNGIDAVHSPSGTLNLMWVSPYWVRRDSAASGESIASTTELLKGNGSGGVVPSSNPTDCPAGSYARGIDAAGDAEGCTEVPQAAAPASNTDLFSTVDGDRIHGTPLSNVAVSTTVRAMKIIFYKPMTFSKIAFSLGTVQAGSTTGVALYDATLTRLVQSGAVDTNAGSAPKVSSFASTTFPPGVYYLAWASDNANVTVAGIALGTTRNVFLNATNGLLFTSDQAYSAGSGGMPGTLGTITKADPSGFPVANVALHN